MLDRLKSQIDLIEQHLTASLPPETPEPLKSAMFHAITAGGKRIRPLLTLLTCEMLGGQAPNALSTACAIEMIHTYSLIHDDLPAMDDDDLRRGKPTVHIAYDEATAILAGDALQSLGFQLIAEDESLTSDVKSELFVLISRAIGPTGMVAGQVLDMQNENQQINPDALTEMHNRKTGDLIATAVAAGACIAGAHPTDRETLMRFGYALGLTFQIRDDLLDVLGTTEELGKPQGSDAEQNKSTFTSFYGLEGAQTHLVNTRDAALHALHSLNLDSTILTELTHYVADRAR